MYICTFICSILKYTKCKHGERLRNEESDFYGKKIYKYVCNYNKKYKQNYLFC